MNFRERVSTSACARPGTPALDHAFRCDQGRARVDDRRTAPDAAERERHRAVGRQKPAAVLVEGVGHVVFLAGELGLGETRALLDDENPVAGARERRKALGDSASSGARSDHDDVERPRVHARRASHPRASAR
jgi:hypothetical protein